MIFGCNPYFVKGIDIKFIDFIGGCVNKMLNADVTIASTKGVIAAIHTKRFDAHTSDKLG
jgi:hypothetical protein